MSKIRILIIDDEKLARDIVKKYLSSYENIEIVGECGNGYEGIKEINEKKPDMIFLDIQMPKINGFEMLELIDAPPAIIFTTAFDQYALKAFEVNALDYLLKPFSEDRFSEALAKALKQVTGNENTGDKVEKLISHVDDLNENLSRVVVKLNNKINIIPVENIIFLEAQDDYVNIHTTGGSFLKQKTMKYFEDHLDSKEFVRIHRSFIVQIEQIKMIELLEKESYLAILKNGEKLPVSKSGYVKLKEILD